MLLLLDDEKGTMAAGSSAQPLLGGALLVELALGEHVELGEKPTLRKARVEVTSRGSVEDPLLREALAVVAEKPRSAQDLTSRIGKGLREQLLDRLVARGFVERHEGRVLGLFPRTTWPAADLARERAVRQRLQDVLVAGVEPDPRTGALVALLVAVDQAHRVVDRGPLSSGDVKRRAKQVAEGAWAAEAVRDAVKAAQAGVLAAVAASSAAATTGSGG